MGGAVNDPRPGVLFPFVAGIFLIAVLFLAGALGRAHQKLLWHDEIIAVVIAGLPLQNMWTALGDGVDLNPPGFHLLLRASHAVFGEGLILTRLPSATCILIAALCIGAFLRRRLGSTAALCGILVFLCSDAYFYAYEARPYGSVLACAAAAFVCWQAGTSRRPRAAWLAALSASLAAALSFHYYAVLLFVPLAAAEIVRFNLRRQADWPVWIAIILSIVPLVLWMPLIASAREFSTAYFAGPSLRTVIDSYEATIGELAVPCLLTLLFAGSAFTLNRRQWHRDVSLLDEKPGFVADAGDSTMAGVPAHEWTLAATLVLLPIFAFLLALGWTGALVPRYYLSWTIGISLLVPLMVATCCSGWRVALPIFASVLFAWYGVRQVASVRLLNHEPARFESAYPLLVAGTVDEPIPIVIANSHVYLVALYYANPDLQARLVTLTPPDGVRPDSDTAIRVFRGLTKWEPVRLAHFDQFVASHRRFFVYGPSSFLLEWLAERDAVLVLRGIDEDDQMFATSRPGLNMLYEVTLPPLTPVAALRNGS